jgi:hypothetical protein
MNEDEGISVGGVSDADFGLLTEYGMVRVIGVGDASYKISVYPCSSVVPLLPV